MWAKVVVFVVCCGILQLTNAQKGTTCRTPNGERAKCISIYDCQTLYDVVTTTNSQQRNFIRSSQCGYDNGPLVCCGNKNNYVSLVSTTNAPTVTSTRTIGGRTVVNNLLPDRSKCGFQLSDRIYSGNLTAFDEFPWMAMLQYTNSTGYKKFSCGGTLISTRYVLTAAHCVTGRILKVIGRLGTVRLGEWSIEQEVDCIYQSGIEICNDAPVDVRVEETLPHPGYRDNDPNRRNDIALVRLNREVTFTDYIRPICLPGPSDESSSGEKLIVAGWGKTEKGISSPVKLKLQVPFAEKSQCYNKFRSAGVDIDDTQICAGGEPMKDSCSGDSGGPLMVHTKNDSSQWYIEGIVSFGNACGTPGWPGVYTKVYEYVDWINDNIKA